MKWEEEEYRFQVDELQFAFNKRGRQYGLPGVKIVVSIIWRRTIISTLQLKRKNRGFDILSFFPKINLTYSASYF